MTERKISMPRDPFAKIEEARLQRSIDAIDRQKTEKGISWHQYLVDITIWHAQPYADSPIMQDALEKIEGWQASLTRSERAADKGMFVLEFNAMKRLVVKDVLGACIVSRELMNETLNRKEER